MKKKNSKKLSLKQVFDSFLKANKSKVIALTLALSFSIGTSTYASPNNFSDLTAEHWAYEAVVSITNRGIMNVNSLGAFRPNSPIDKFETSRVLALAAGFNNTDQSFIDRAVSNNQTSLNAVSNRFERWNPNVNREISFLMELGVLTNSDINNFIIINNNSEELRALSRQEAAVFMVRATNLSSEVGSTVSSPFTDNSQIAAPARTYIDYLRINGIVSGDGYGNFYPNIAVTRAAMALMLYRTLNLQSSLTLYWYHQIEPVTLPQVQPIPTPPAPPQNDPIPPSPPVQNPLPTPPATTPETLPTIPNISTELSGIIYKIDEEANFIVSTIRFLSLAGTPNDGIIGLRLATNFEILRNEQDISLSDLDVGDAINLTIVDGRITKLVATERNRSFTATLVATKNNAITISYRGNIEEIGTNQNTTFERQGQGEVPASSFRIGDELDIIVEDNIATNIFAFGTRSTVDGTVKSLNIENNLITISIETQSGERTIYRRGNLLGVYVGSRVRFQLDSSEVLSFSILN